MENLQKKPRKSILKSSSSFEQPEVEPKPHPNQEPIKWDEVNILQTLHPPDKDYGLMKIEEPKTPYTYYDDTNENSNLEHGQSSRLDMDRLMQNMDEKPAKVMRQPSDAEEEEEDENLTEEEKAKKRDFEIKRKMHYNEFQAVKLARKLLEEEIDDEDEEGVGPTKSNYNHDDTSKDSNT